MPEMICEPLSMAAVRQQLRLEDRPAWGTTDGLWFNPKVGDLGAGSSGGGMSHDGARGRFPRATMLALFAAIGA